jgi:hypothetical protein
MIPRDPIILLSFVNLKLRDFYPSLDAFCASECVDKDYILDKLESLDYEYNEETNQFTTHWGDYAYPDERPKYPWET